MEDKAINVKLEKIVTDLELIPETEWKQDSTGSLGSEYTTSYKGKKVRMYMNKKLSSGSFPVIMISKTSFHTTNEELERKMKKLFFKIYDYFDTIYREKIEKRKFEVLNELETELNPEHNTVFIWAQIKKAIKKIITNFRRRENIGAGKNN